MPQANSYDCYDDFVIRTPLFSLKNIHEIPSEKNQITEFVKTQWKNPIVKDAIMLASPSFFNLIDIEVNNDNLSEKIVDSFIRYFVRMSFRCTPFGMFAGIGAGKITKETSLFRNQPESNILHCRLDMEYLGARVMGWTADHDFIRQLSYIANTSLYKHGEKWRYIELFYDRGSKKKYRIVSLEGNDVLDDIISESTVLRDWGNLAQQIIDMGYGKDDAEDFIEELINSQILIPEIFPNLTGIEFSKKLQKTFTDFPHSRSDLDGFQALVDELSAIKSPGSYYRLFPELALKAGRNFKGFNSSHLVQADMGCTFNSASISRELSNKILLGIRILKALSRQKPNHVLEGFVSHFIERFGSRQIPLSHVMDSEFGIGLMGPQSQQMADPCPLLDGMNFPMNTDPSGPSPPNPLLLRKLKDIQSTGDEYIKLDKNDIKELALRRGDWPHQLFAMCRLSRAAEDNQVVFDLVSSGHPSHIIGRFGFSEDKSINNHISDLIQDDIVNHSDQILAEIVHLPEDRTGNILQRPSYYNWEILYLASSGGKAKDIKTDDILISVVRGRLLLKHQPTGKKIIPRLTNAHNYKSRQLPLYQFLAEYANQESGSGYFPEWGWLAGANDFVPGIRYGNLILSSPQWRIKIDEELKKPSIVKEKQYQKIISWVEKNKLPKEVVWMDGDHEMLIDWSNLSIVMSAWESIRKRDFVVFKDNPFKEGSPVISENGEYANEIILSFKKSAE